MAISYIIKRDGRKEIFLPSKLNGWGEWASKNLGKDIDWGEAVLHAYSTLPVETHSVDLQNSLIDFCLVKPSFAYNRMAGKLYISLLYKQLYDNNIPTIKDVFKKLVDNKLMSEVFFNSFSEQDYQSLDKVIDHKRDFNYAHYQIKQMLEKYSLSDRVNSVFFETPQFSFIRVAMRMCLNKGTGEKRIARIKRHYEQYSKGIVNIPTPYFTNSGTNRSGFASCCLHSSTDTVESLSTGDHISYMMTVGSAGQGSKIYTRPIDTPVKGGSIIHSGKINYYKTHVAMINANLQNGRGGAETQSYDCYDPEWKTIQKFKNQLTPSARQVRGLDYAMCFNRFFVEKAAKNQDIALLDFNKFPDLYEAMCDADTNIFESLYNKYLEEDKFTTFENARDILLGALEESIDTGRHYFTNLTEINTHTPFKEYIRQSNLCQEITLKTKAYKNIEELYLPKYLKDSTLSPEILEYYKKRVDEIEGEIAICSLSAIAQGRTKTEEEYQEAAWVSLDMIHTGITESDYMIPHAEYTSKKRMSAGVGMINVAYDLAKNKLKYDTQEGRDYVHKISERHYWHLLNASLELSKEFGNAEWMHKTKWTDENSWLPLDTYNKNIDSIVTAPLQYNWEELRQRIIANGGHAFTVLAAHMPTESSASASGCTNSVYPIRDLTLKKTNETLSLSYVAPDLDKLAKYYQSAWDISVEDMAKVYGIIQKFTDQAISADVWYDVRESTVITSNKLLSAFFFFVKYGVKTRYYANSNTKKTKDEKPTDISDAPEIEADCESCKL